MKIIGTADIHGQLPDFLDENGNPVEGDVLCIAGDLTFAGRDDYIGQAAFINGPFHYWTIEMKKRFDHIIVCAGNHDKVWEKKPELIHEAPYYHYLEDSSITIDGVKFWGTPWTKPFFRWGFNARDEVRQRIFDEIPDDIDVLLSHGPPSLARLGMVNNSYNNFTDEDVGDEILTETLKRVIPKYVFCGHIHEGYGKVQLGTCEVFNCSYVTSDYEKRPNGKGFVVVDI